MDFEFVENDNAIVKIQSSLNESKDTIAKNVAQLADMKQIVEKDIDGAKKVVVELKKVVAELERTIADMRMRSSHEGHMRDLVSRSRGASENGQAYLVSNTQFCTFASILMNEF